MSILRCSHCPEPPEDPLPIPPSENGQFRPLRPIESRSSLHVGHTGYFEASREGYGREVPGLFLDEPAREQRRAIEVVTADGAKWTKALARRGCPNARRAMDPFRVAERTSDALDEAGREEWRVAEGAAQGARPRRDGPGRPRGGEGAPPEARALREAADAVKGSRCALVRSPGDPTGSQRAKLAELRRAGASSRPGTSRRA